jgi:hypothetical protein
MKSIEIVPAKIRFRGVQLVLFAAVLYLVFRLAGFHKFTEDDSEGIGALVQLVGTLYSVVYAFAIYVIWGQFTSVESEIQKESGALKDLLVFSRPLKDAMREPIVRAVKNYARSVDEIEWRALSQGGDTEKTDKLFGTIIAAVTEMKPEDETESICHGQLVEIVSGASSHRDERISLSRKRMPKTLLVFVMLTALTIVLLLLLFPFRSLGLGLAAIAITAAILFFAHFVLTDLDNPFEGTWNLSAEPFAELGTKYR